MRRRNYDAAMAKRATKAQMAKKIKFMKFEKTMKA